MPLTWITSDPVEKLTIFSPRIIRISVRINIHNLGGHGARERCALVEVPEPSELDRGSLGVPFWESKQPTRRAEPCDLQGRQHVVLTSLRDASLVADADPFIDSDSMTMITSPTW